MSSRVFTSVRVLTLTRTQTMYRVVDEIVSGITGRPSPDLIAEGILERPYLRAVVIYVVNSSRQKVASVDLRIDWEKHEVYSQSSGMSQLTFDSGKSISGQISDAIEEITRFIGELKGESFTTEVWYQTRTDGPIPEAQIDRELGIDKSTQLEWAPGQYLRGELRPEALDELTIDFKTKA